MSSMISTQATTTVWTSEIAADVVLCLNPVASAGSAAYVNAVGRTRLGRTDDRMKAGIPALGAHPFGGTEQGSPPRGEPR